MIYNIISMEEFDSIYGKIKKGDIINTIMFENLNECKQWAYQQYGPNGENIRIKIKEVKK